MTLKTTYKFIIFERIRQKWYCLNKRHSSVLGTIIWDRQWCCHVFEPCNLAKFSADCLRDVADFLEQLDSELKVKTSCLRGEKVNE